MNLEIYQDKKHFRNFWSIFIKLAQKMRYRLLNTSYKFHQNPIINKDFFSIMQSIENNIGERLFSSPRIQIGYLLFSDLFTFSMIDFVCWPGLQAIFICLLLDLLPVKASRQFLFVLTFQGQLNNVLNFSKYFNISAQ